MVADLDVGRSLISIRMGAGEPWSTFPVFGAKPGDGYWVTWARIPLSVLNAALSSRVCRRAEDDRPAADASLSTVEASTASAEVGPRGCAATSRRRYGRGTQHLGIDAGRRRLAAEHG